MGWYDDHKPGDALWIMVIFFFLVSVIFGIMVFMFEKAGIQ